MNWWERWGKATTAALLGAALMLFLIRTEPRYGRGLFLDHWCPRFICQNAN